ncbi:MAG: hypothetical protein H7Y17_04120 [Chlorobia bacterium]|nr:hypothetical protein [Fimbriimonadaceae bacterium]
MRRLSLLILLLVTGCVDKERAPVLGMWTGGFYTDEAEVLRGYLQLYQTGDKFKMRLGTKDQEMTFLGTWSLAKNRVDLRVGDIDFENPTEETQKALGLKMFTPDEIRAAFGKPITLDLATDGKALSGLTITIGKIQGKHRFKKGEVTANTQKALDGMKGNR